MGILSAILGFDESDSNGRDNRVQRQNPDLVGTASCQIGKKDEHGVTATCNFTCPMWHRCSRGSQYNQWYD